MGRDALLAGYGEHDRDLVELLVPVQLVTLAAWTFDRARRTPEYLPVARHRLRWAAGGLAR